ncbi:MAG: signal peptidase II [Actinomycetota bacterium]|nr:signal peptidase II [Actinomycetota bacterium]
MTIAALATLTDAVVKALVVAGLSDGSSIDLGFVTLRLTYNPGIAFSLGSWLPPMMVTIVTGVIISTGFTWLILRARSLNSVSIAGSALLLGGALGNFVDRLDGQGVVDYFHTGWFATFNLADALITVGVVLLATGLLTNRTRQVESAPGSIGRSSKWGRRTSRVIKAVDGYDGTASSE